MRFVHTADWHLGRLFHARHLTDDQAFVLDQLVDYLAQERPNALVVAGDLYDRANPPTDAVRLLDDTLERVRALRIPVIAIAGNHDSPERIGFATRVLSEGGLHLVGDVTPTVRRVTLRDPSGVVHFFALPYAEPSRVRECLAGASNQEAADESGASPIQDHDEAMRAMIARINGDMQTGERTVLVAHAFVAGGVAGDSERPLSIGGAEKVHCELLKHFSYAALGHLHRPQSVESEHVRYSGSLLKYSFKEWKDVKGFTVVEISEQGTATTEQIALAPRFDVRCIEGTLDDLLEHPDDNGGSRRDYLSVRLLDPGPVLDAMSRLRVVYPNVMHLERAYLDFAEGPTPVASGDHRAIGTYEVFEAFFHSTTGAAITVEQGEQLRRVLTRLQEREREGVDTTRSSNSADQPSRAIGGDEVAE